MDCVAGEGPGCVRAAVDEPYGADAERGEPGD